MKPKVSVIIPNYNHAAYLTERIESVIRQSLDDIEVIILDDCSTDNSREIIEKYRNNPKISHIVYNDVNTGTTFAQWRKGFSLAQGEYIWIAESDDSADTNFLSTLVALMDADRRAVMAFSGSNITDSLGNFIPGEDWDKYGKHKGETITYTADKLIGQRLLRNNLIYNASMVLFRRDSAPEITAEILSMKYCGDWLFWERLAAKGDVIEVCRKLNNFRQHHNKVSNSASKEGKTYTEGVKVVAEMADRLQLTTLQRRVLVGRICKRLKNHPELLNSDNALRNSLQQISKTSKLYPPLLYMLYEADKLLNFSHLPPQTRG